VIAFYIGDRRQKSGEQLWANLPAVYQPQAVFDTDLYEVYKGVIPPERHKALTKKARKTNHLERFNSLTRPEHYLCSTRFRCKTLPLFSWYPLWRYARRREGDPCCAIAMHL
jgi:IS1 family transposase